MLRDFYGMNVTDKIKNREKRKKVEALLSRLPENVRECISANPELIDLEILNRRKIFPSKDFIPNIGQMRAFEPYRSRHPEYGDFAKEMIFRAGNGVGKTCSAAVFTAGCTLGVDFVNREWLDLDFFREYGRGSQKAPLESSHYR